MKWDEVEREFFVIGNQLDSLGKSFRALAAALARERGSRGSGSVGAMRAGDGDDQHKDRTGPEPALPF